METQRVRETKNKIKKAFLALRKTKRIDQISIKEIATVAGVNRSTFYVYYMDIYDLKEKVEKEVIEEIKIKALPILKGMLLNGSIDPNQLPVSFIQENRDFFAMFFSDNAEPQAIRELKSIMKSEIRKLMFEEEEASLYKDELLEFTLEYLTSAQLGIIKYWIDTDMKLPANELAKLMEGINLNGAITQLKNKSKSSQAEQMTKQ